MEIENVKENFEINHEEYVNGKSVLSSYPRTIFVELTRSCNMYCTCCRQEIYLSKELDMTDEILENIEKKLFPTAKVIDFRGWGESTLDPRLLLLIERWENKDKELFLYTNCQTQDPAYWEKLFHKNVNVTISLRSGVREKYEGYMRGASYNKLISHLEMIPKENKVVFTCVIGDENISEMQSIVELANKYNIRRIQLNPLAQRTFAEDYPTIGVSKPFEKKLIEELVNIKKLAEDYKIDIDICADLLSMNKFMLQRCVHPWSYCYISYNGEVGFCDHLMCVEDSVMGNIKDDFNQLWNSEKYQTLRKKHCAYDTEEVFGDRIECKWCYKNRYGNWEYIIEPKNKYYHINDYIVLQKELNINA